VGEHGGDGERERDVFEDDETFITELGEGRFLIFLDVLIVFDVYY